MLKKLFNNFFRSEPSSPLLNWRKKDLLKHDAHHMISGVLRVFQLKVRDVMIAKAQMITVSIDDDPSTIHSTIKQAKYSRYPVLGNQGEEVVGILLAKDLLQRLLDQQMNYPLKDMVRPAIIIPESQRLDSLLKLFRNTHNHMAIVVDEFGSIAGLITIEDVLEQIVGEIEDEDFVNDEHELFFTNHELGLVEVDALAPIAKFNHYFKTDVPSDEFDTIGGVIAKNLGHLPKKPGSALSLHGLDIVVLEVARRRIKKIGIKQQSND